MDPRLKKVLVIAAFIFVTAGIAYLLFRVFFQPFAPGRPATIPGSGLPGELPLSGSGQPSVTGGGGTGPTGLPSATSVQPGVVTLPTNPTTSRSSTLTQAVTRNISISPSGAGVRAYNPTEGKFYRIADDGTSVPLSNQVFYNVDKVDWGKSSDKAILSYPDGSKILYDFNTSQQVTLPKHWEDFDFSPQDDRIAAKSVGNNENNRFLITANPDGTNAKAIEDLGNNKLITTLGINPNIS